MAVRVGARYRNNSDNKTYKVTGVALNRTTNENVVMFRRARRYGEVGREVFARNEADFEARYTDVNAVSQGETSTESSSGESEANADATDASEAQTT